MNLYTLNLTADVPLLDMAPQVTCKVRYADCGETAHRATREWMLGRSAIVVPIAFTAVVILVPCEDDEVSDVVACAQHAINDGALLMLLDLDTDNIALLFPTGETSDIWKKASAALRCLNAALVRRQSCSS